MERTQYMDFRKTLTRIEQGFLVNARLSTLIGPASKQTAISQQAAQEDKQTLLLPLVRIVCRIMGIVILYSQ